MANAGGDAHVHCMVPVVWWGADATREWQGVGLGLGNAPQAAPVVAQGVLVARLDVVWERSKLVRQLQQLLPQAQQIRHSGNEEGPKAVWTICL